MSLLDLIKQPRSIKECGIDYELLIDLALKHLHFCGVVELHQLADRMALNGKIMAEILDVLRKESWIFVLAGKEISSGLRYQLTDSGHAKAKLAILKNAYLGQIPVEMEHYRQLVAAQSVFNSKISRRQLQDALAELVIEDRLIDLIGPALHSSKAIMFYGPPGTGKTYLCKHISRCLGDPVYLPYAISVGREIIQFFDPLIHTPVCSDSETPGLQFASQIDRRLVLCQRPIAFSGVEFSMEMSEISYDQITRLNQAPIQLKANNGIYIFDDLGRQRVLPLSILNRWLVPMEEHIDYLTIGTGQHFPVPFDNILIFSTNLNPQKLADGAFLRRLSYKIKFSSISPEQYQLIWANVCREQNVIVIEEGVLEYVFQLYEQTKRPILPCEPKELICIALNIAAFKKNTGHLSKENIFLAWETYFMDLTDKLNAY